MCVCVRVGFNVFVRVVCNLWCDVVWYALGGVCVCVCLFLIDCAWMPCL